MPSHDGHWNFGGKKTRHTTATRRIPPTSHGVTETEERGSDIRISLRWTVQPVVYGLKFEERRMTLLVAFALCLQDKAAEETFKKIEETELSL